MLKASHGTALVGWTLLLFAGAAAGGCGGFGGSSKAPEQGDAGELKVIRETEQGGLIVGVEQLGVQFEVPSTVKLVPHKDEPIAAEFRFADSDKTFLRIDRDKSRYFKSALDYIDKQRMKQDGFEEGDHEDLSNGWDADYAYQSGGQKNLDYFSQFEVAGVVYRCQLYGRISNAQVNAGRQMCRSLSTLASSSTANAKSSNASSADCPKLPFAKGDHKCTLENAESCEWSCVFEEGSMPYTIGCLTPDMCGAGSQCCAGMSTRCVPEGECNGGDTPLVACSSMADCPKTHYGQKVTQCGPSPSDVPGLKACLIQ